MYKYAIDQGFVDRCAQYGITKESTVRKLMKIALSDKMQKALLGIALGGGLGAGAGYLADEGRGALIGGLTGAGAGGSLGYHLGEEPSVVQDMMRIPPAQMVSDKIPALMEAAMKKKKRLPPIPEMVADKILKRLRSETEEEQQ